MKNSAYKLLYEQNSDAIIVVDSTQHIREVNPTFLALTSYTIEDIVAKDYRFFLTSEQQLAIRTEDQRFKLQCKDGQFIPVLARKTNGEDGFFLVLKDMRKLDQIAENYLESELRYRLIAENIQDVIILMDAAKNYLYVSPSALKMYKFDYRNIENRPAFFNIHPDYSKMLEQCFDQAMLDGQAFTIKLKAWHEELQWLWTEIKGQPMYKDGIFQHMLLVSRDISQQQRYEEKLLKEAYTDALTNLPNRRKMNELLNESRTQIKNQTYFAVMLMDIDSFKHINDHYGHEIGDFVLIEYGERIAQVLGEKGTVGRYGGDEFLVILHFEKEEEVKQMAQKIIRAMEKPFLIQQTSLPITISIGIVLVKEDVANRKIVNEADHALYKVKEAGKNHYFMTDLDDQKN